MSASLAVPELLRWVDTQEVVFGTGWLDTLEGRKREEAEFHDEDRRGRKDQQPIKAANRRFYQAAQVVQQHIDAWLARHAAGSVFLDYACGNGMSAVKAAEAGAALALGIDISEISVGNAIKNAAAAGVAERTRFLQRDCEDTRLPADTFTACLCCGMLHHLDLNRAFPELHRIMAPQGRILCVEALSYNPVIQLYRKYTPHLRTQWEKEHILSLKDVRFADRWFQVENIRYMLMAAPLATLLPEGALRRLGIRAGHMLDAALTRIPGLRLWSWQFTFELVKRD